MAHHPLTLALVIAIALLMLDAILETALISATVYFLHNRCGKAFAIDYNGSTFSLHGKPFNLIVNHGHVSNGAAGTAFVLIGICGFLALWLLSRGSRMSAGAGLHRASLGIWYTWVVMTVISVLLSISALVYTFLMREDHKGQTINIALAAGLNNHPYPNYVAYPDDVWTPEDWFTALLRLPLQSASDRSDIHSHLLVVMGWRWNLIPMVFFGLLVAGLAVAEAVRRRREGLSPRYHAVSFSKEPLRA